MANVDGIEIKHPCSASWAAMDGDDRARFCKLCSKVVHDTTALTTCELEKMLEAPTPPCLRVHRDRAGRVLTRDRLAALAFVGLAACTGAGGDTADTGLTGGRDVATLVNPAGAERLPDRAMGTERASNATEAGRQVAKGAVHAVKAGVEAVKAGVGAIAETVGESVAPPPLMGEPAYVPPPEDVVVGRIAARPPPESVVMGAAVEMPEEPAVPTMGKPAAK